MSDTAVKELEKMNNTLKDIRDIMKTPKSLVERILEYGGGIVTILGIMTVIDIIKDWLSGG